MKTLLATVLMTLVVSIGAAQSGWTHTVSPAFPEPFDFVMLPWERPAEPRDMGECWHDLSAVPFLGADYSFWCFVLPVDSYRTASSDLRNAMRDVGIITLGDGGPMSWLHEPPEPVLWQIMLGRNPERNVRTWYFEHDDGLYLSIALRGDLAAAEIPLVEPVEPIVEPEPEVP